MVHDFRKKRKTSPKNRIMLLGGGVVLLLVFFALVVANVKVYQKKRTLAIQIRNLENKVQEMKSQNSQLEEAIAKADDAAYMEKVARVELDLQKPGEKVVSFVKAKNELPKATMPQSGWQAWLGWLAGFFQK